MLATDRWYSVPVAVVAAAETRLPIMITAVKRIPLECVMVPRAEFLLVVGSKRQLNYYDVHSGKL